MKGFSCNALKKSLIVVLYVICLLIIVYIFVLPRYVLHQVGQAQKIIATQGNDRDVLIDTDDEKVVKKIMEYLDVKNAKRIFSKSVGKYFQSLPLLYINLDDKFRMSFWVYDGEGVCYMDLSCRSFRIELGSYEIDINDYHDCLVYLNSIP